MNNSQSLVRVLTLSLSLSLSVAACGKSESDKTSGAAPAASGESASAAPRSGFKYEGTADNLKAFFGEIQGAIRKGDVARAAALTREVVPTEASLKKALRDDAPAELSKAILTQFSTMPSEDAAVAKLFQTKPERSEIQVHGATTEQIAAFAAGTPAGDEFPRGARDLAAKALRPGATFYELELLEPGQSLGMKYHLFFFDGSRWVMLGPAWRALKQ